MSIEFKVKEYCENCNEFEPDVDKDSYTVEDFDFIHNEERCRYYTNTTVTCKHAQRCESMVKWLKKQKGAEDE